MAKYLISFPAHALTLTGEALASASIASHAVIEEAKAAGVYVFAGGINEQVAPVLVSAKGPVSPVIHDGSHLTGGFEVFELPTRDAAMDWARKLAAACGCGQEVREFMYDPAS